MIKGHRTPRALEVVVDCQPLAQVVNGAARYAASDGERVMTRTVEILEEMVDAGTELPEVPVEWRPRHMNQMADHMVNLALDRKACFEEWKGEQGRPPGMRGVALTLFVDGGVRQKTREGAAGWYLVGTSGDRVCEVARGGLYYGSLVLSSYMAEARALLAGLEAVRRVHNKEGEVWLQTEIPCLWEMRWNANCV